MFTFSYGVHPKAFVAASLNLMVILDYPHRLALEELPGRRPATPTSCLLLERVDSH